MVRSAHGQHHNQVHSGEGRFGRQCKSFISNPFHSVPFLVDLFATRVNTKFPIYVLPISDTVSWKEDAFQHRWDDLSVCAIHPFTLLRQVVLRVMLSCSLFILATKEWFTDLLTLLVEEPLELHMLWVLLVQPHVRKFHKGLELLYLHT